jgi:hypothetical protein
MIQKIEVTKSILAILNPTATPKQYDTALKSWWCNRRNKTKGGLRLTEQGYLAFLEAEIKDHHIKFEDRIEFNNQLIIWLDQFIDCPFFITNREIIVFGERTAVQLVLFSGNVDRFVKILANNAKSA